MTRPFRFGCQYFSPRTASDWKDTARSAEDLGFSVFHVADHYIGPGAALSAAAHPVQSVAAIPAMMAAAAATDSIMVGCRVLCVDYHHPVVLAKELATIDLLSDGRLEAGFGAGWITSEYEAMGITMDRPGVRIDRLIEVVGLARAFFAGGQLSVAGDHVHATDFTALPGVVQEGGPKVMIGGGSARILRTAGELADIVSINFDNSAGALGPASIRSGRAEDTARKLEWVRQGAGERFDDLEVEIAAYFTNVTDRAEETVQALAGVVGLDPAELESHPHALVGSVDHICETLERRREATGISYVTVGSDVMSDFAPVVDRLAGN